MGMGMNVLRMTREGLRACPPDVGSSGVPCPRLGEGASAGAQEGHAEERFLDDVEGHGVGGVDEISLMS